MSKNISLYETMILSKWVLESDCKIYRHEVQDACVGLYVKENSPKIYLSILKKYGRKDPSKDNLWIYDPENSVKNDPRHFTNFLRRRYDMIVNKTFEVFKSLTFLNAKKNSIKEKWELIHIKNNEDKYTCKLNIDFLIVDEDRKIGIPFSFVMINEKQIRMTYNIHSNESETLFKFTNNIMFFETDYFLKNKLYKLVNKYDVRLLDKIEIDN